MVTSSMPYRIVGATDPDDDSIVHWGRVEAEASGEDWRGVVRAQGGVEVARHGREPRRARERVDQPGDGAGVGGARVKPRRTRNRPRTSLERRDVALPITRGTKDVCNAN